MNIQKIISTMKGLTNNLNKECDFSETKNVDAWFIFSNALRFWYIRRC
jgi:hypothetical protein